MIHPSALVSPEARIGKDVTIGPYCHVFDNVEIGDGCVLKDFVVVGSPTSEVILGKNNELHSFCVVGGVPQDMKYSGETTKLVIGDGNEIREYVTINIGTKTGGGETVVGNNNLIMAYCHVAHDSIIGNNVIIANQTQIAGHVTIEDRVHMGGMCGVNQFVRIGKMSFIAGGAMLNKDVLPFTIAQGDHATIRATNKIGLDRGGIPEETIKNINRAVRIITKSGATVEDCLKRIKDECGSSQEVDYLLNFVKNSSRGLALG